MLILEHLIVKFSKILHCEVVQGVVVGDPETESQSAASEVSSTVTANKSPSVAERAAQGLGSAASRVRMLASSTGTLSVTYKAHV